MTGLLVLLAVAIAIASLTLIGRRINGGRAFHLDQFRPAAPLIGILAAGPPENRTEPHQVEQSS